MLIGVSFALSARANVVEVKPGDDVEAAMNALKPGDELVLQGGTYTLTDAWHVSMMGTAKAPITVRAKDGEHPHLSRPSTSENIIDFDDVQYLEFRGIEVSGGSAGLRLIKANFVTIRDCEVHDTDDVAISANSGSEYQGLQIIHNHIHDTGGTGEGMYIGCNDNGCRVHDSVFAENHIHNTNGPNVSQGDGIEIKEGSFGNIVRDNVIHDTGYPCIITYSTVGNGPPNIIERNVLWNCGDHGIQSAADVVIRNNIILGTAANGIANQPHQAGTPANIQILHNTIVQPMGDAIASTGITGSVLIANNAVYANQGRAIRVAGNLGQVTVEGNMGQGALEGVAQGLAAADLDTSFVAASYSGMPPNDVFPRSGSKLAGAGSTQYVVADDFNATSRNGVADIGAYAVGSGANPGWAIGAGFKDQVPTAALGTGGAQSDAGAGAAGKGAGAAGSSGAGGSAAQGGGAGTNTKGSGGSRADAGVVGARAGDASAGHALGATGTAGSGMASMKSAASGCNCRVLAGRNHPPWWLGVALLLVAMRRRGSA